MALIQTSTHHSNAVVQHTLTTAAVGSYVSFTMHYLPTASLILSTIAATLSIVSMISGGLNRWSEHRAKIKAAEITAKARVEAASVKAQAQVVAKALEVASTKECEKQCKEWCGKCINFKPKEG